jgi:hypothetical protein
MRLNNFNRMLVEKLFEMFIKMAVVVISVGTEMKIFWG